MSDDDNVEDLYQDFHDNPMYWAEKYTELRTLAQAVVDSGHTDPYHVTSVEGAAFDALAAALKGE